MTVNETSKKLVRERAKFLCEYCHSLEEASAALFAIDHIIPQSLHMMINLLGFTAFYPTYSLYGSLVFCRLLMGC
jgi:hypothetical protein